MQGRSVIRQTVPPTVSGGSVEAWRLSGTSKASQSPLLRTSWVKIKHANYTQIAERPELFERRDQRGMLKRKVPDVALRLAYPRSAARPDSYQISGA
jgi:hypothetical protein